MKIEQVLAKTNWKLLSQQKLKLLHLLTNMGDDEHFDGLLNWIDSIQYAAEEDGYPVVWLTEEEQR